MSDQRRHDRSNYRTLVTVLTDDASGRPVPRSSGPGPRTSPPPGCSRLQRRTAGRQALRPILLPELEDKIVECVVVRRGGAPTGIILSVGPRYVYGVRFQSVLPNDRFEQTYEQSTQRKPAGDAGERLDVARLVFVTSPQLRPDRFVIQT